MKPSTLILTLPLAAVMTIASALPSSAEVLSPPLVIQKQGSFAVGGTVAKTPGT